MSRIQELIDKRANLWEQMKALNELTKKEGRVLTAEEDGKWATMNKDMDAQTRQIEIEEQYEQRSKEFSARVNPGVGRPTAAPANPTLDAALLRQKAKNAFRAWLLLGPEGLNEEERSLLSPVKPEKDEADSAINSLRARRGVGSVIEVRAAQAVGSGAAGGFALAEGFVPQVEKSMLAFGGVQQASRILKTDSGVDLPWPTVDDTSNTGELLAENVQAAQTGFAMGQIILKAYKYSSKEILVPTELLEDASVDIEGLIAELLGERIGRITNTHFTTGDNSSKPQGVVTASSAGKTAASATAITVGELIDLFHSVDPEYRNGPNVGWMFKDSTLAAIRKLTLADWAGANAVWQPGLAAGQPPTILDKRYTINQDMAAIATTAKTVLFGDFSKYMIRDVTGYRLVRNPFIYGNKDQVSIVAFKRFDGRMLDAGTDPVKHLVQA